MDNEDEGWVETKPMNVGRGRFLLAATELANGHVRVAIAGLGFTGSGWKLLGERWTSSMELFYVDSPRDDETRTRGNIP